MLSLLSADVGITVLRELVNYRHPDPRRVWKGGSGRQFTTPLPVDPVDHVDHVDQDPCSKLVFRVRETLLLTPELAACMYLRHKNRDTLRIKDRRCLFGW